MPPARTKGLWPYESFQQALRWWKPDELPVEATGRSQNVNAAFNAIAASGGKTAARGDTLRFGLDRASMKHPNSNEKNAARCQPRFERCWCRA
jgi:hypothetical protein